MVITEINGLPQGTPSYKSSSVRRFKNFVNTLLWSTQHPGTCIRAMLIVHPLPAIFTGLFFTESIMDLVYSALPLFVRQLSKLCYLNILLLNLTTILWSALYGHSCLQTHRHKTGELWLLFPERGKGFHPNFSKHISNVCTREHNQIQVIKRFRHTLSDSTKAQLYKAFIMPRFQYCSSIWHFCGARNSEKL